MEDAWPGAPLPVVGKSAGRAWNAASAIQQLHHGWCGVAHHDGTLEKVRYDETELIAGIVFRKAFMMVCLYLYLARLGKQLSELELCRQDTFSACRESQDGRQYLQYSLDILLSRSSDAVETMQDLSSQMHVMDGANAELTTIGASQEFSLVGEDGRLQTQLHDAMPVGNFMQAWSGEIMHGADVEMKATLAGIRQSLGLMHAGHGGMEGEVVSFGSLLDSGTSLGF